MKGVLFSMVKISCLCQSLTGVISLSPPNGLFFRSPHLEHPPPLRLTPRNQFKARGKVFLTWFVPLSSFLSVVV